MNRRWATLLLLGGAALAAFACRPGVPDAPEEPAGRAAQEPALFEDVTDRSGVRCTYRNGEEAGHLSILESAGGGVGVLDYDGDGLMDLFFTGGGGFAGPDKKQIVGAPCKLYRNLGGGRFQDVTARVGLGRLAGGAPWFYTHGVAVGDYDRDGRPDLLVTGWGRVALFRNVGGTRFEDVTAKAGLDKGITWATSAAWADLDGDGWPDLYVCQYVDWSWQKHPTCKPDGKTADVCTPGLFAGLAHKVYRNDGKGAFTDVSSACGLAAAGPASSKGLGVLAADLDGDGRPELYVTNDGVDKFLYLNQSKKGKVALLERGVACGAARDDRGGQNGSMGVDAGDPDGSGRPALWVTNYEGELHGLYRNLSGPGGLFFGFQTTAAGAAVLGQGFVGWGTAFIDFDLDGAEDLFVSHGHAVQHPEGAARRQRAVLLAGRGDGRFRDASGRLGPFGREEHLGRGAAFVDLDNDGRIDVVLNPLNEPATVLRNVAPAGRHWLGVQLARPGGADVVGARVVLEAGGRKQTRFAKGGGSYASSSDRRLVFGLGAADRVERLGVYWPDGTRQEWAGLAVDAYHVLTEGEKEARAYPAGR
jgi:hypothetical protein